TIPSVVIGWVPNLFLCNLVAINAQKPLESPPVSQLATNLRHAVRHHKLD
ncbi:hypothetical protein L917_15850, partial [Phytophthora nicotianae]